VADERFQLLFEAQDLASPIIGSIGSRLTAMVGTLVAVGAAAAFLKSAINDAAEAEQAVTHLGQTVRAHGGDWDALQMPLRNWASAMIDRTGETDEALMRSVQTFITYGATVQDAMHRTILAVDIARNRQMDLETVTNALARAQIGMARGLVQLGINIREVNAVGGDMTTVWAELEQRFSGAAIEDLKTYTGQVRLLAVNWGEFREEAGTLLLPVLNSLVASLNDIALVGNRLAPWQKFMLVAQMPGNPLIIQMTADALRAEAQAAEDLAAAAAGVNQMNLLPSHITSEQRGWLDEFTAKETANVTQMSWLVDHEKEVLEASLKNREAFFARWDAMIRDRDLSQEQQDAELRKHLTQVGKGNALWQMQEGPTSDVYEHEEDLERQRVETMKRRQEELAAFLTGSTENALDAIVQQFMAGRLRLADVFKGMASDFLRYFVAEIARMVGAKLAAKIFGGLLGIATGNPAAAIAVSSAIDIGGSAVGDWVPSTESYGKVSAGTAGVVVVTPIGVTQTFVRKEMAREVRRLRAAGVNI
jgi:hypothetical protein